MGRELEKVAATRKVSMKVLLRKYKKISQKLGNAQEELRRKSNDLCVEKNKYAALHERSVKYAEEYETAVREAETWKNGMRTTEDKCRKLEDENEVLKESFALKNENDMELENLKVNLQDCMMISSYLHESYQNK